MKLSPEQIAKIESMITMREDGYPNRAIMIACNIREIVYLPYFFSVLRDLGIEMRPRAGQGSRVVNKEYAAFAEWLVERRAQKAPDA